MKNMAQQILEFYIDLDNNYENIDQMAEAKGMSPEEIEIILLAGFDLHELFYQRDQLDG